MDARQAIILFALLLASPVWGASSRTRNFIVSAPTPELAAEIAQAAERYRHDLAIEWLGKPLPDWNEPCPLVAHVDSNLGAGGRTSFMFQQRTPFGWEMEIQGSRERLLDSVLPHEVTHTIFATHFGGPLPRWADEGACTTVEHSSERKKQELWLIRFLKTERGIPFNHMFAMTEYPGDIMPLYSQGYSVARFLIAQGGKRKFVEFVGAGLSHGNWNEAVRSYYAYPSLGDFQTDWVEWVIAGSPDRLQPVANNGLLMVSKETDAAERIPTSGELPSAELMASVAPRGVRPLIEPASAEVPAAGVPAPDSLASLTPASSAANREGNPSWYARRAGEQELPPAAQAIAEAPVLR